MKVVLAMVLAGLVALPLSAGAQDDEEGGSRLERWHPGAFVDPSSPEEPTSEPAPEEPALELKLDDAGVEVTPSPPRTADGYTLEEMNRRVRRAGIGLGVSVVAMGGGAAMLGIALSESPPCRFNLFCPPRPDWVGPVVTGGAVLLVGGFIGTLAGAAKLARNQSKRRELQGLPLRVRYETPRRAQWDLARSRLVF